MQKTLDICDICGNAPAIIRDGGRDYCSYDCYMVIPDKRWFELIGAVGSLEEYKKAKQNGVIRISTDNGKIEAIRRDSGGQEQSLIDSHSRTPKTQIRQAGRRGQNES